MGSPQGGPRGAGKNPSVWTKGVDVGFPESWSWKSNREIDGDLRAYAEEHGLADILEDDDCEPSEEALRAAKEARKRVLRRLMPDVDWEGLE